MSKVKQLSIDFTGADIRAEWKEPTKKDFNVIELFAGCGGMSLGWEMAGCNVIAALDFDKFACKTYRRNFNHPIIEGDIRLDATKQKLYSVVGNQRVDVVFAGFPCQSFSTAGLRLIDDERNFLYREFLTIVNHYHPKYIAAENVKGFMTKQGGIYPKQFKEDFARIGYTVEIRVLNAADYGAAQNRERTIIIGCRNDAGILFPIPIVDEEHRVTVMEAIGDLMDLPEDKAFGHIFTNHEDKTRESMKVVKPKDHMYVKRNNSWRMLPMDEPAFTMTENHGAMGIHPVRKDMITPREMARLQSFPDSFDFSAVSKTQMIKQIGNAVAPLMGKAVALAICEMDKRGLAKRLFLVS